MANALKHQMHVEKLLPFQYNGLTNDMILKSEKELNETAENRRKGLDDLRSFIEMENLPKGLDDEFLLKFLRRAKFEKKKSREGLSKYCSLRKRRAYSQHWDIEKLLLLIDRGALGISPYRDREGRAVIFSQACGWTPEVCGTEYLSAAAFALFEFMLSFPATTVCGVTYVANTETPRPTVQHTYFNMFQKCFSDMMTMPMRLKKVYILNVNYFIRLLYELLRPFLPSKIKNRVHLQKGGVSDLNDFGFSSIMPYECGGTMGPMDNSHFRDQFVQCIKKLKEEDHIF